MLLDKILAEEIKQLTIALHTWKADSMYADELKEYWQAELSRLVVLRESLTNSGLTTDDIAFLQEIIQNCWLKE